MWALGEPTCIGQSWLAECKARVVHHENCCISTWTSTGLWRLAQMIFGRKKSVRWFRDMSSDRYLSTCDCPEMVWGNICGTKKRNPPIFVLNKHVSVHLGLSENRMPQTLMQLIIMSRIGGHAPINWEHLLSCWSSYPILPPYPMNNLSIVYSWCLYPINPIISQ